MGACGIRGRKTQVERDEIPSVIFARVHCRVKDGVSPAGDCGRFVSDCNQDRWSLSRVDAHRLTDRVVEVQMARGYALQRAPWHPESGICGCGQLLVAEGDHGVYGGGAAGWDEGG